MSKLEIKKYEASDYPEFKKYINAAFNEKYILGDSKYIDWQFGNSLALAKAGDKIIGHFGFRDFDYKFYDQNKIIRVLMNLSVIEEYRLSGAAVELARWVFDTRNPILVSDARPVAHNLFTHLRSGWADHGQFKRYLGIINGDSPVFSDFKGYKKITKPTAPYSGVIKYNIPLTSDIEAMWKRARVRYPITIERSSAYLSWRFWRHPFFDYEKIVVFEGGEPRGFLIFRIEGSQEFRIMRIIDWVAESGWECQLLQAFLEAAFKNSVHAVDFFSSNDIYEKALFKSGFFLVSGTSFEKFPILFSPLSYRRWFINIESDFIKSLNDCFLTKADGDQDRPNPH